MAKATQRAELTGKIRKSVGGKGGRVRSASRQSCTQHTKIQSTRKLLVGERAIN